MLLLPLGGSDQAPYCWGYGGWRRGSREVRGDGPVWGRLMRQRVNEDLTPRLHAWWGQRLRGRQAPAFRAGAVRELER